MTYPATGEWAIYSVQKTLPFPIGQAGALLGKVHGYLVLVDPAGNPVEEMQGFPATGFEFNASSGDYLRVAMYTPGTYFADQTIESQQLVLSGTQSDIISAFNNAALSRNLTSPLVGCSFVRPAGSGKLAGLAIPRLDKGSGMAGISGLPA
jgi:hypothetical protein